MSATNDPTYPPLDTLKPVGVDLWIVDSGPLSALGMPLPIRMTVVRLSNGDVWLHSPTRYTDPLRREIEALGPIRHLVAPNIAHWTFLQDWQRHCPEALTWAAPELRARRQVRRSGVRLDRDLGDKAPAEWSRDLEQIIVTGGLGFRETAFFHIASRTLILTDIVQNLEPEKMPPLVRPLLRLIGSAAPHGSAPVYLRLAIKLHRRQAVDSARRLIALAPERVVFSHGVWFDQDGTRALRHSLRWLVK
jgi:hypothetical protein